ncbi:hypothetical protein [Geminicoccus flavidas]|uniref:hypothetical protein n=1 Tax=Geminicoccus flavidas TaxID=2506407 RepID=UPI0013599803|nr:hypothetical protein [Geminicoccus flavidas]
MPRLPASLAVLSLSATLALAACMPPPSGPGRQISAEQADVTLKHPRYPGVAGEHHQRVESGVNARTESAIFAAHDGIVMVWYGRGSGDTYYRAGPIASMAQQIGTNAQVTEQGTLANSFPKVEWAQFTTTMEGMSLACVAIQRSGDAAGRAGAHTSALITAVECRDAGDTMGEQEAAMLSSSIQVGR